MLCALQVSSSTPTTPELAPRPDSDSALQVTRSRSLDSLEHHLPWRDFPDPDDDDIGGVQFGGGTQPPRAYHWESRNPNGSSSFSFSMYSRNGGPVHITTNRGQGRNQLGEPGMVEVQHDFENMVQTMLGVTPQGPPQGRGTAPGGLPFPSLPLGFPGQPHQPQQPQGQGLGPIG